MTELFLLKTLDKLHLSFGNHRRFDLVWKWLRVEEILQMNLGRSWIRTGCVLFVIALMGSSCNNTRYLQADQALYKDSRVIWDTQDEIEDPFHEVKDLQNDLGSFEKQEANSKILGVFLFKLWFYNLLSQSEEGFLKAWINNGRGIKFIKDPLRDFLYPQDGQELRDWFKTKIGEPPVLYDSVSAEESATIMEAYLTNNGYFQNQVEVENRIRRKRGKAIYHVNSGPRYTLRNIIPMVGDSLILKLISKPQEEPVLRSGAPYRLNDLKQERARIRDTLLNNGYYTFDRNLIVFELDSLIGNHQMDVYIQILPPLEDSILRRYRIGEVYCFPDYRTEILGTSAAMDTIMRRKIHLIATDLKFKPTALVNPIFITPGSWYNATDHALTLRKFTELGAFKFVSISYRPSPDDSTGGESPILDAYIRLQPSSKQQWSAEINTNTNFNSLIGSDVDFSYRNRNLFHNADLFTLNLSSGLETQVGQGESFIRNVDFTGSANLEIPKFIIPFKIKRSRLFNPVTSYAARYTFIKRLEYYTLHSTSLTIAYGWRRNSKLAHRLAPIDISIVRPTDITDEFRLILNDNFLLTQSFQQQIIPGASYSILYNVPNFRGGLNEIYFRGTIEAAGNLVNGIAALSNSTDSINNIGGIPLSQYSRIQTDLRYYIKRKEEHTIVFRLATGFGVAYGNSAALPFVKQFFVGGPSSVRAWRVRRLGPGSFEGGEDAEQNVFIDQTGDMSLESNFEYRFPIYKVVKGAFFVDAGNIWLLKEDETRPGGKISSNFYREIAIGTGIGLRLDFSLFVFRADFGFRVRDPALEGSKAWLFTHPQDYLDDFGRNTEFNIAIGYPF